MASYDFIFGGAASGKSTYIYKWLSECAKTDPDGKYFLFVPEQNTLKAQKKIVELGSRHGMLNLDVLSFQLLFYRVTEELGINKPDILDDMAKSLLIRKAAADALKEGGLKVYSKKLNSEGFIKQINSLISEFGQYDISHAEIESIRDRLDNKLLKDKLGDIGEIYLRFKNSLNKNETIPEEIPQLLLKYLDNSELLKDAVIVFDGYTGFTPIQLKLLSKIMPMAKRVRFSVTIEEQAEPYRFIRDDITDIWWLSKKNIAGIIDIASAAGVIQSEKRHIFINGGKRRKEGIRLICAEDPFEEIREVVRDIKFAVVKQGARYNRMAVAVSDPERYREIIKREMAAEDISFFMDDKASAAGNPVVEFFRAAISAVGGGYKYDDVMRFVKNPLVRGELENPDTADEFDNSLRKSGIRGKNALKNFAKDSPLQEDIEKLSEFGEAVKDARKFKEMISEMLGFADNIGFLDRVQRFICKLNEAGYVKEAYETERFSKLIFELFERMSNILGETEADSAEFFDLIEAGFINMKGGLIPETMDILTVGDLKRSRIEDIDVLYIVGANDGILPSEVSGGGIFTDSERMEMEALSINLPDTESFELAPDDRTDSCIQKFYLYMLMNKPASRLVISYSKTGRDGRSLRPSPVLDEIDRNEIRPYEPEKIVVSKEDGLRKLAEGLSNCDVKNIKALYNALKDNEHTAKRTQMMLKAAFFTHEKDTLSKRAAEKLYKNVLHGSISRLEEYASCPFSHFLKYGLRLKEREEFKIEALDIGNLFHSALDMVFTAANKLGKSLVDISQEELDRLCEEAVEESLNNYKDNRLSFTSRNRFIAGRVKKITKKTIWALKNQIEAGRYKTLGTETSFKVKDGSLELTGKIDRIDHADGPDCTYVKIIDYKTGNRNFDIVLALDGLQIQLTAYMDCALMEIKKLKGRDKDIIPAGMFYYHINDPVIDFKDAKGADIDELSMKALRMNGAVLKENEALNSIDTGIGSDGKDLEKESLKKSEVFLPSVTPLTREGFKNLISTVRKNMQESTLKILDGDINIFPYKYGEKTGCDFCSYKGVCGFSAELGGYMYRNINKSDAKEVLERLNGEDKK